MKIKGINAAPSLVAVIYLLLILSGFWSPTAGDENPYLSVIVIELLIFVLPALFFFRLRGKSYASRTRVALFEPGTVPFIIIASVALILLSCTIKLAIYRIFDYSLDITSTYTSFVPDAPTGADLLFSALAFAVFPAVTEELVFRGIVLAEYEECGPVTAVLVSSLLFAMLHFDLKLFPVYFVSGILLALSAYACRSVFAPMLIHTFNNVFGLFFEDYIWNSILQPRNIVIFSFVAVSLLLISLMLLFGEASRLYRSYGNFGAESPYILKKSERTPTTAALISVPFALCVLIFVLSVLI